MRTIELTEQDYSAIQHELDAKAGNWDASTDYEVCNECELWHESHGVQYTCNYIVSTTLLGCSGDGLTEPREVDYLVNVEITDLQALDIETDEAVKVENIDYKRLRTCIRC